MNAASPEATSGRQGKLELLSPPTPAPAELQSSQAAAWKRSEFYHWVNSKPNDQNTDGALQLAGLISQKTVGASIISATALYMIVAVLG